MPYNVEIIVRDPEAPEGEQIQMIIPLEAYGNRTFAENYANALRSLIESAKRHEQRRRP